MNGEGLVSQNDLPDFSRFYFDRVWLKAYPRFWNSRDPVDREKFREYMESGVFQKMTDRAFDLYRTLNLIRLGIRKGFSLDVIPDHVDEILRYGEGSTLPFEPDDDGRHVLIKLPEFDRPVRVSVDRVMTLRFVEYVTVIRGGVHYEKGIYMELSPWVRFVVKPFVSEHIPIMIRIFYNPLIRAKHVMGLGDFGFEHVHDNYIDPYQVDLGKFVELNHRFAFDYDYLNRLVYRLWRVWFGRVDDLRIKVTQVEYSFDTRIPKDRLIGAFHFIGGRAKTLKSDVRPDVEYQWVDAGIKYYITIRKGLQVKLYTKAWNANNALNRVEFTFSVNKDLDSVSPDDVVRNEDLLRLYFTVKKALLDDKAIEKVKEILKPLIRCRTNCEKHYEFWIDLLLTGQMRGSRYFSDVIRIYRREGLVEVKGRGRNTVYVPNVSRIMFSDVRKALMDFLGIGVIEPLRLMRSDVNRES